MSNWTMVMPLFESRGERTSGRDRIDHSSLRERLHCSLSHARVLERFRTHSMVDGRGSDRTVGTHD